MRYGFENSYMINFLPILNRLLYACYNPYFVTKH